MDACLVPSSLASRRCSSAWPCWPLRSGLSKTWSPDRRTVISDRSWSIPMNQRPHLPPRNLPAPKSRSPPRHRPTPLPLPPPRSIPPHPPSSTMTMTGMVTRMATGMRRLGTWVTRRSPMRMTPTNAPQRAAGSRVSVRVRLLIGMILRAGLTLPIAGAVNYFFERKNLETTLDEALARDVEELRVLADTGIDPNTQQHFTSAADLMYTAMQYNQVAQNQSMLAMQD